jgi:hypothetical protein
VTDGKQRNKSLPRDRRLVGSPGGAFVFTRGGRRCSLESAVGMDAAVNLA